MHERPFILFFPFLFIEKTNLRFFAVESFAPLEAVCYNNAARIAHFWRSLSEKEVSQFINEMSDDVKKKKKTTTKRVINEEIRERSKGEKGKECRENVETNCKM